MTGQLIYPLACVASATLFACTGPTPQTPEEELPKSAPRYLELGDLPEIQSHGLLRVLTINQVPRAQGAASAHFDGALLDAFARQKDLELDWIHVHRAGELVPRLLEGRGDLIVSEAPLTLGERRRIAQTVPVASVHARVAARVGESVDTPASLADRRVAARPFHEGWEAFEELRSDHPGIRLERIVDTVTERELLQRVADGRYDIALSDDRSIAAAIDAGLPLLPGLSIGRPRLLRWSVRPGAAALVAALDRFLNQSQVLTAPRELFLDDLAGIRRRGTLRVLTRNSPASYYVWRGRLMGFEYELCRRFAKKQRLAIEMVVPPPEADLIDWLLEGKGDMVAASLAITQERIERGVAFTRRYHQAVEKIIARHDDPLRSVEELGGRTVVVNPASSYWKSVERVQRSGIDVTLEPPPEPLGTDEIISRVADGEFDLSVADSHIAALEMAWRDDIVARVDIGAPVDHGWAVRAASSELLAALDGFIGNEYRGLFYNVVYDRYFKASEGGAALPAEARAEEQLSPWDDLVRSYASSYGFDWRLVVAQMCQESRFDPQARSTNGALGLMQMLPRTAGQLGFGDLHDPETGIHAGVKYLAWLRDRFESDLTVHDRTWFALAAYNAGYGHVEDARRLALELGLDRDRWFSNVERAMLLLSRPDYAQGARYGYCRGREPVAYVRRIRDRFAAYTRTAES